MNTLSMAQHPLQLVCSTFRKSSLETQEDANANQSAQGMETVRNITPRSRRRWLRWALVACVAFILCELVIRHIPPDGASLTRLNYHTNLDGSGPGSVTATTRIYTSPRDRAIIDKLNNALNTAPLQLPAPLLKGCQNGLGGAVTFP